MLVRAVDGKMKKDKYPRWSVTMYVTEAEYQLILSKAELLDTSISRFSKQAVQTYIKHLEKHLKDTESVAA
ncbi:MULTISPECIES: hypothetical protein [unclassified Microcoleus]|uniref:hypothetical protein n=1 Tax=unclassified Microcoleus TaxID=2642155 RepID=UPI002FD766B2